MKTEIMQWAKRTWHNLWFNCAECLALEQRYDEIMSKSKDEVLLPWSCTLCGGPLLYSQSFGVLEARDLQHSFDCRIESQEIYGRLEHYVLADETKYMVYGQPHSTTYIEEGHPF